MSKRKRILVGALNWGLGHASRCVHLIKVLEELNYEPVIASDGAALKLLRSNFPKAEFLELPELKVNYAGRRGLALSIIAQLPKLNSYLRKEKKSLDKYLESRSIDLIISDNRYGIYHEGIPSVFITHQLKIKSPIAGSIATGIIKSRLKYFDECWIPDDHHNSLSAELSSTSLSIPKYSIGPLSQFANHDKRTLESSERLLIVLSGPEPSRSLLEEKLIDQAESEKIPTLLIRGSEVPPRRKIEMNYVEIRNVLNTSELIDLFYTHERIICRSGYSSIMDLTYLGKSALLIPTPGQVEQEYLATYHKDRQNFYSVNQKEIDLKRDLEIAYNGEYHPPAIQNTKTSFKETIQKRIESFNL